MALEHYKTQVLLLHSQQGVLDTLSTGFNKRYSVHCATSGIEALNTLTETPVHVIVSAQDLPGMSGLDAIREAQKRSPSTIGILLAGDSGDAGIEALVGEQELFEIVRGQITGEELRELVDSATRGIRMMTLAESANDFSANVDEPADEHIVMQTSSSGSAVISDGTGSVPALQLHTQQNTTVTGGQAVDVLVLTKDEEFLATIRDSVRELHEVHHAITPTQAEEFTRARKVGVLVTDAAMVGSNIEVLTTRLRAAVPRLVTIVAGRRDDGEMLMDLINRGQVYRFLLKPVSPGRARLAIEASTRHHIDAVGGVLKEIPQGERGSTASNRGTNPGSSSVSASQQIRQLDEPSISSESTNSPFDDFDEFDEEFENRDRLRDTLSETLAGLKTTMGHAITTLRQTQGIRRAEDIDLNPEIRELPDVAVPAATWPRKPVFAAIALAAVVAVAYFVWRPASTPVAPNQQGPESVSTQRETTPGAAQEAAVVAADGVQPVPFRELLEDARFARDSGQIFAPPGTNAIEIYGRALNQSGNDPQVAAEFNDFLNIVFGIVETALLEQRLAEAEAALTALRIAAPHNQRLAFLNAQFGQQVFRNSMDQARAAIRGGRFEDAAQFLRQARSVPGANLGELGLLSDELETARSEQRVDQVLARANQRVDEGKLISPPNDNARYYYELALNNDPQNTIAEQGLLIVAGKLVLEARAAMDSDRLDQAALLLADAQVLDPASSELAAAQDALEDTHSGQNSAAREAEASREAEQAAEAQAVARAEQERQAEIEAARRAAAAAATVAALSSSETAAAPPSTPPRSEQNRQQSSVAEPSSTAAQPTNDSSPEVALLAAATAASASLNSNEVPTGTSATRGASTANTDQAGSNASTEQTSAPVREVQTPAPASVQQSAPAQPVASGPETVSITTLNRIKYSAPKYPRNAMRRNITGSVDLAFTVGRDGSVFDVEVVNSTPGTMFDKAATDSVGKWRFEPVFENGIVVERRSGVRLAFNLQ